MLLIFQTITRFAAITLLSFTMLTGAASAQNDQTECADMGLAVTGEQAFTSFCGRCHRAEKVATWYENNADADAAEQALAAFLDGHGPCPHDRHEAVAAYLRQVSGR